ncbi:hypothetical protein Bbelb_081350 [Branchiostoma belcheri]|nr:hypothetical protein Bbelb_081350 [Branchiostoma belcheri]
MYEEAEPVRTPQAGSDRKQPSHDPPGRLGNTNGHVHRGKQAGHENKGGQGTSSNVYEEAEVVKLENISGDVPYGTDTSTDTDTTQRVGARVYCMVAALAVVVALAITGPILLMFINGGYNHEEARIWDTLRRFEETLSPGCRRAQKRKKEKRLQSHRRGARQAPTTQAGPAALPPGVHPAPSTPLRPDCDHNRHQHHAIPQTDMGQFVLPG